MAASFVDDCICAGTDEALDDYRWFMAEGCAISDLGAPTDFLGMQIHYDHENKSIKIYQEKYIQKTAERFDIQPTDKPPKTPLPYDKRLEPTQEGDELVDPTLFHAICGSIAYSAIACRIDIALAIHELSKHMVTLNTTHMAAGGSMAHEAHGASGRVSSGNRPERRHEGPRGASDDGIRSAE